MAFKSSTWLLIASILSIGLVIQFASAKPNHSPLQDPEGEAAEEGGDEEKMER